MLSQVRRLIGLAAGFCVLTGTVAAQQTYRTPARTSFVNPPREPEAPEALPEVYSSVSLIDSAMPRTTLRLRADFVSGIRRPTMAEYFQPQGGLPFTPGPPRPETNLNYQEYAAYVEYAVDTWFSLFLEQPLRWVNPEQNDNAWGQGDLNAGFKLSVFNAPRFLATFQLRVLVPTARNNALGSDHFTLEPALLASYRIADSFQLEGELRYWAPIGGTDFAGDILRYGLGLSYGQQGGNEIWITPVVEVVGWSMLGGKALNVTPPDIVSIEALSGQTIVNAQAGVRLGLGANVDFYAGYNRALTGATLYRDMARFEFRLHW
jgi:hypothetical protein